MPEDDHTLLLLVNQKVDLMIEALAKMQRLEERVSCLEGDNKKVDEQISTLKDEVSGLKKLSSTWNVINSIGLAVYAFIYAVFKV